MTLTPGDKREIDELIAQKLDIMSAFRDLPDADRESIARDLEGFLYGRAAALPSPKNTYTPRITASGADINLDSAGIGKGHAGPTLPRWIDFVGATGYLDSTDPQIAHIKAGGGGADCMFDVLVSTCFSSLTGWTEGQVFTSLSGCTFKTTATPQKAADYIRDNFSGRGVIFICKGSYDGGLHIHHDLTVDVIGAGRDVTTIYGLNNNGSWVVDGGTTTTGPASSTFRDLTFDGTQGTPPVVAVFGNSNGSFCSLHNIRILVPSSAVAGSGANGAQFDGNEQIDDLRIIGPASGSQANTGFTSANNAVPHNATNVTISGCKAGAKFTNASFWNITNLYVTGANGTRGDSNADCGGIALNSNSGLSYSTLQNIQIVDSVVGISFANQSGYDVSMQGVLIKNCTTGMDLRGSATGISGWVFNGFQFVLGTAGQTGVNFQGTQTKYSQFTNMNFVGYASGNEFITTGNINTGTVGYHNISDAGLLSDFGPVVGHASSSGGAGGAAPNDGFYVVWNTPSASLPNSRQYIGTGTTAPGGLIRPEGAFFYDRTGNALYITSDGAGTWQAPQAMKVYTSLGESPNFPVSIL